MHGYFTPLWFFAFWAWTFETFCSIQRSLLSFSTFRLDGFIMRFYHQKQWTCPFCQHEASSIPPRTCLAWSFANYSDPIPVHLRNSSQYLGVVQSVFRLAKNNAIIIDQPDQYTRNVDVIYLFSFHFQPYYLVIGRAKAFSSKPFLTVCLMKIHSLVFIINHISLSHFSDIAHWMVVSLSSLAF